MSVVLYLIFCALVAYFANKRGRSPILWGLFSLLISPLLAAIIIAVLKDLTAEQRIERTSLETDRLKERVAVSEAELHSRMDHVERQIDRMKGKETPVLDGAWKEALPPQQVTTERHCSHCGEKVPKEAVYCPSCGSKLS